MKKTEIELRRTNDGLQSNIEEQAACLYEQMMEEQIEHKGRPFSDVSQRQLFENLVSGRYSDFNAHLLVIVY